MTNAEIRELDRTLGLLTEQAPPFPFLYAAEGPDGAPALLVDRRRLDPERVLALVQGARSRRMVRGMMRLNAEGQLLIRSSQADESLLQSLAAAYGERIPLLQAAKLVPPKDKD